MKPSELKQGDWIRFKNFGIFHWVQIKKVIFDGTFEEEYLYLPNLCYFITEKATRGRVRKIEKVDSAYESSFHFPATWQTCGHPLEDSNEFLPE